MFFEIGVLKIFGNVRKIALMKSFCNKVGGSGPATAPKKNYRRIFYVDFTKLFTITFLQSSCGLPLLHFGLACPHYHTVRRKTQVFYLEIQRCPASINIE